MQHFTSVHDVADIAQLVEKALNYKQSPLKDITLGAHKRIGLLFMNPSMRTRLSTQLAAKNLGMETIVFNANGEGWMIEFAEGAVMNGSTVEHIKDAAPIFGSYFDILCVRAFPGLKDKDSDYSETLVNSLKKYAGIPIVSLESTTLHPLQSLADVLTIKETFTEKRKPKIVMTWAPHINPLPQCVPNSFAEWVTAWDGADFTITHPEGYELDAKYTAGAAIEYDRKRALDGADFVYVKNWSSYTHYGKVLTQDESWMPTLKNVTHTNNAKIMHCLPVRRNVEVSDEILESANSIVTQQAGNRIWAAQAVLAGILNR